ncbi:TetR family transcriptional regulator [soil metagenome]
MEAETANAAEPTGLRQRKKQATRERISSIALERFARDGFAQTTVGSIAADAGVATRTFFHYFETKEDVLLGDLMDRLARLLEVVRAQPEDMPPLQALWGAMESLADGFDDSPEAQVRYGMVVGEPSVNGRALDLQGAWEDQIAVLLEPRCPGPDPLYQAHVVTATGLACLRTAAHASTTGTATLRELLDRSYAALGVATAGLPPR